MMISCVCCVWKEFQGVPVEKRESVCGFVDSSGVGWGSKKRDAMREAFANMMQDSEPKCSAEKNCPFKDVPCLPSAPLIPINQLPFKCDEYSYELWQWYDGSRHLFLDKFILPIS